jgi:hypothetical protein
MLYKTGINSIYHASQAVYDDRFSEINSTKDNLPAPSTNPRAKNNVNFMDPYASFKIISKLIELHTTGVWLNSAYNLAYLKAFEQASAVHSRPLGLGNIEAADEIPFFYDTWLTLSDKQLDEELKSTTFISLLSCYTDSLVELHSMMRQVGYPVYSFRRLLYSYMESTAKFSSSIQNNNLDHAPYDIIFAMGKARLLHYYDDSNNSGKEIAMDRIHKYKMLRNR